MVPEIKSITRISPEQSVVCILGSNTVPDYLALSKSEKEYARKQLAGDVDHVFINSYFRSTYLVKVKSDLTPYKVLEELRKSASGMKKLIKSNNHGELVISSSQAPDGAVEAFAEGLILSAYSFDKYKTGEKKDKKAFPSTIHLHCNISKNELAWLNNL